MTTFFPILGEGMSWLVAAVWMILSNRFFGLPGLWGFMVAAILIGNVQVYKMIALPGIDDPVGMGTGIMTLTFIVSDYITELWGPETAKRVIIYSFLSYLLFIILLGIAVHVPLAEEVTPFHYRAHGALKTIFTPAPGIFWASVISYIISQFVDIHVFAKLKQHQPKSGIVWRSLISSSLGAFLDNGIFSILAWVVFHPQPLPLELVWHSFMLWGFVLRICLTALSSPFIWILKSYARPSHALS